MLDLRDDGTIGIDFDSGLVVLPRPKLGLVEKLNFARTDIARQVEAFAEEINRRDGKPAEGADPADILTWNLNGAAEVRARSKDLIVGWWREAFEGLGVTAQVPADADDWPAWMVYGAGSLQHVTNHWLEVPLARGGTLLPREQPVAASAESAPQPTA